MNTHRHLPLLAALLVTACAGDDGSASSTTTDTTASASASASATSTDSEGTTDDDSTSDGTTTEDTGTTTTTSDPTATTSGESTSTTDDPTTTGNTTEEPTTTGGVDDLPPIDTVDNLLAWLEAKSYADWPAESGLHQSSGPHGGQVRTFLNDTLFDSFDQGLSAHPEGSVAVKELWGDGNEMIGWAIEVKVQPESAGGDGWYWYELIGDAEYGGGTGVGLCTGCHGGGGTDYVLTPWPLQ